MTASVNQSIVQPTALAEPFDSVALDYDRLFTNSSIGQAQRAQVSREIERCFSPGSLCSNSTAGPAKMRWHWRAAA